MARYTTYWYGQAGLVGSKLACSRHTSRKRRRQDILSNFHFSLRCHISVSETTTRLRFPLDCPPFLPVPVRGISTTSAVTLSQPVPSPSVDVAQQASQIFSQIAESFSPSARCFRTKSTHSWLDMQFQTPSQAGSGMRGNFISSLSSPQARK